MLSLSEVVGVEESRRKRSKYEGRKGKKQVGRKKRELGGWGRYEYRQVEC